MMFPRLLSACALAAASFAVTTPLTTTTASADDILHQVKYTVTSSTPYNVDIYYRDVDPPNWAEYSHNPYLFSPKIEADIGPNQPWVLNVALADPNNWAMVSATSGWSSDSPGVQCTLEVDGVVVSNNDGPKGALCSIRSW
ncbi:hypothetical protein BH09ACT8_BH09ACT8_35820 [soil metagenome]